MQLSDSESRGFFFFFLGGGNVYKSTASSFSVVDSIHVINPQIEEQVGQVVSRIDVRGMEIDCSRCFLSPFTTNKSPLILP